MNILRSDILENLWMALGTLRANKLRSVLTTLGIVIGIVTVTLMGTAIEGLNRAFLKAIAHVGADVLYVQCRDWSAPDTEEEWHKQQKWPRLTIELLEGFLVGWAERGLLRLDDPHVAAVHLVMLCESDLVTRVRLGVTRPTPHLITASVRQGVETFLRAYRAPPRPDGP